MSPTQRLLLATLLLTARLGAEVPAADDIHVRRFDGTAPLAFEITDRIRLPKFWWPRTLVSYPVRFDTPDARASELQLRDSAGNQVPFQLSEVREEGGRIRFATVHFFTDLPSGGSRRFELTRGTPPAIAPAVTVTSQTDTLVLASAQLKVRIPASRTPAAGARVPGPILQMDRGAGWLGDSSIHSPNRPVREVVTEITARGPLFAEARVEYRFDGGARYVATIRLVDGYDFVEFDERMEGLPPADGVTVEQSWTQFRPTHRWSLGLRAEMPIDRPYISAFRGEDPPFTGPSQVEDPAREMWIWMEITPSNGWGGWKEAEFWDAGSGAMVGLFMTDPARWQDHAYSIWVSTDLLRPRFRYADGLLHWRWPLVTGTRATGVVCGQRPGSTTLADDADNPVERRPSDMKPAVFRRSRYGDLSLNRIKDMVLACPPSQSPVPPLPGKPKMKDAATYDAKLAECGTTLVASGMYHPVAIRDLSSWIVPDYTRLASSMTTEQRERAAAIILLSAYLSATEDHGPMRRMLGGHPNFMADYQYALMGAAHVFPHHPLAAEWRDQFEKFLDLCGRFHTRPAVPQWEARGGRWTESIATYNWAYLRPSVEANQLGMADDGRNRFASPWYALHGDYLVGIATAPVMLDPARTNWPRGVALSTESGFQRIHPPQGAHSSKRAIPGSMHELGHFLHRFAPLTAEHLMWVGAPTAGTAFEAGDSAPVAPTLNRGTNPRLRSAKYTGYGIVLRAAVDTPEEISVFLQQIDKGPNYRWGFGNQNGSGDIYYYAEGRSFSGHGFEDAGDRHADDALNSCNTGVYKDYHFHSIGMNELTRPFYDLDVAQFAELVPAEGPGSYSWPEYRSRSVLLVGSDYIVIHDAINGASGTRFAWNSQGIHDHLPFIHHIKGGADNIADITVRGREGKRGVVYDVWKGGTDRLMLVTHQSEVRIVPPKRAKGTPAPPFSRVSTPTSEDCVFQNAEEITHSGDGMTFRGTCGVVRRRTDRSTELALIHGARIGTDQLTLGVNDPDLGVSAVFRDPSELKGSYFGRNGGELTLEFAQPPARGAAFYVDGARRDARIEGARVTVKLPPGGHRWEWTARRPQPATPEMIRTENRSGAASLFFTTAAGADQYRIEVSADGGSTWTPSGTSTAGRFELKGLTNGTKVHVRIVARNDDQESRPGRDYPVYVTDQPPAPPDGLQLAPASPRARLAWGEVLGASEYRLYRRPRGETNFTLIHRGPERMHEDATVTMSAPPDLPGRAANALQPPATQTVYEYAVAAVNGNGEGPKSVVTDTEPTSWRNWNPPGDLRFKRRTGYWMPPYVKAEEMPPEHYPDADVRSGE